MKNAKRKKIFGRTWRIILHIGNIGIIFGSFAMIADHPQMVYVVCVCSILGAMDCLRAIKDKGNKIVGRGESEIQA